MVLCCNNQCPGVWFHYSCCHPTLTTSPIDDWYCSAACEEAEGYIYCTCKKKLGGKMLQCYLKDQCKKHEWYHVECIPTHNRPTDSMCFHTFYILMIIKYLSFDVMEFTVQEVLDNSSITKYTLNCFP